MGMHSSFSVIHERALQRKGGEKALAEWMPKKPDHKKLATIGDDRCLSEMTRCVFQAGFVYRVINDKWPQFEEAFWKFDPEKLVLMSPEQLEGLGRDTRIVRNMQKILSVPHNAQFILDISKECGGFGDFLASWPTDNLIGLLDLLKQRGSRLGGMTGQRVFRNLGRDTFVLTSDVINCLIGAGIDIKPSPTTKRELKLIQETFNNWVSQSGLTYTEVSRICACSVGDNYELGQWRT